MSRPLPEGFIYSDPAPDMRLLGVRGLACRSANQVDLVLGKGFLSSSTQTLRLRLLRTPGGHVDRSTPRSPRGSRCVRSNGQPHCPLRLAGGSSVASGDRMHATGRLSDCLAKQRTERVFLVLTRCRKQDAVAMMKQSPKEQVRRCCAGSDLPARATCDGGCRCDSRTIRRSRRSELG